MRFEDKKENIKSFVLYIVYNINNLFSLIVVVGKPLTPPPRKLQTKKTKMRSRAIFAGFDETDSDEDEFENNRGIVLGDSSETSPRSGRRSFVRAPPKKRQPRKLSTAIVSQEKTPSVEKTIPVVVKPKDAAKQVQIKRSILADWGDDDEDGGVDDDDDFDKMDDESKEIQLSEEPKEDTSSLELTEITVQDKSEDSPKKPIRNIPKKDRCRNMNNLDEFYKNQVPSSSASNATDSAVIVLDSEDDSDDNVRKMFDDDSDKEREELGQSSDDQVEEVIDEIDEIDEINIGVKKTDDEQELQILETGIPISLKSEMAENTKTVDNQSQQETNNETRSDENDIQEKTEDQTRLHMDKAGNDETTENKNELDSLLLQHSAELLEETSQLTANIETVGVIEKKKRLQRKHKITESEESVPSLSTADEDQAIQINSEDSQIKEAVEQSDIIENGESNCSAENKNDEEKSTEQLENNIENSLIEENNSIEEKIEQIIQETNTEDEVTEKEVHENMIIVELLEAETSSIQNSEIIDEITTEDVTENKENENQIVIESSEMIQEETVKLQKLEKQVSIEEPRPPSRHSLKKYKSESTESRRSSRSTRQKSKSQSIENVEEISNSSVHQPQAPAEENESKPNNIEKETELTKTSNTIEETTDICTILNDHIEPEINTSILKNEPSKTEVDCFDFKEEEDDIPRMLSRPKRRPLEKRFVLDPIEDIRKNEEEELKLLKLDPEIKEKSIKAIIGKSPMKENDTNVSEISEAQSTPEKGLPIKERNKRIFKSRNRSMHSESDSFSNEEKTPTKQNSELIKEVSVEKKIIESQASFELSITTSIESEIADTLINNLPLSSPNTTINILSHSASESPAPAEKSKAGQKHILAEQSSGDESPQPKKPIKMTFALSGGKNEKATARIVKKDDENEEMKVTTEENEVVSQRPPRLTTKIAISKRKIIESSVEDIQSITKRQKSSDDDSKHSIEKNDFQIDINESNSVSSENNDSMTATERIYESSASMELSVENPAPSTISSITQTLPITTSVNTTKAAHQIISASQQPEPKKKRKSNSGKVEVIIGHDAAGNPITHYQKPRTGPVVHLPSHIRTPDMVNSPSTPPFSAMGGSQIVITSKGTLITTNSPTDTIQSASAVTQVSKSSRPVQQAKSPNKIQVHSQKIIASAQTLHQVPSNQFVEELQKCGIIVSEPVNLPQPKISKGRGRPPIINTAATNQITSEVPQKTITNRSGLTKTGRLTKRQQLQLQQQEMARRQAEAEKAAELSQNIQDNQLLAIPAENFDGPAGAFYLCTAENNTYFPIDRQPLYLDEKNQLVPMPGATGPMNVAAVQEDIIDDSAVHASNAAAAIEYAAQAASSQITTNLSNLDDSQNLTYLINTGDGQQILLDQQSMLQLTANGELPQFITADGQQLILQGTPQDFLAAISNNQQEMNIVASQQIIIPEEMTVIEEDGNNHDILAAALADTEVFQQDQYIGDVLQIQQGNGIINQAATSETNAILPPIMSTLEQPSKSIETAPNVDCSNLDESLAVIGVSTHHTNVPASLELPITVTNPDIAPKTTNAISGGIYPNVVGMQNIASQLSPSIPIVSEQDLSYELFSTSSSIASVNEKNVPINTIINDRRTIENENQDVTSMDIDSNSEIIPNTPESVTNQARSPELTGFTSDNSNNSCEIPLQSNLILRPPSTDGIVSQQQHIIGNRRNSDFLPNHYRVNHLNQHQQHSSLHSSPIRVDTIELVNETYGQNHTASDSMLMGSHHITTTHRSNVNGIDESNLGNNVNERSLFMNRDNDEMENDQFIVEEHMANNHQFDTNDEDVDDQYNR